MKLNVPDVLKVLLVDDWEAITKNNQAGCSFIGWMRLPHYPDISTLHPYYTFCDVATHAAVNIAGPASSDAKCNRDPPRVQRSCREDG